MADKRLPRYRELPSIGPENDRHAWGVFGKGDELGAINLLTPEAVMRGVRSARKGKLFNLSLPLDLPNPPLSSQRSAYKHDVFPISRTSWDDKLDNFYMQASSQWDGLRHVRYREHGFYNGLQDEEVKKGALGIHNWAQHGIAGRGLLLDVARHLEKRGTPLDQSVETAFDETLLQQALDAEGLKPQPGDILLLRTGWIAYYLSRSPEVRADMGKRLTTKGGPGALGTPGLKATQAVAGWLWDHGFAAVAADNPAVEAAPGSAAIGNLHRRVLPLLGIAFGELWDFEELAKDCAADGVYEAMLVSVPLNLPGGVGSPANALALK